MELDPVDEFDPHSGVPASGRFAASPRATRTPISTAVSRSSPRRLVDVLSRSGRAWTGPFKSGSRACAAGDPAGPHALLLVSLIAILLTLAVATYGVEADRRSVAAGGLAATAVVAIAIAVSTRKAIRSAARSRTMLKRALAESERVRDELHVANERLHQRSADLQASQLAVAQGFDLINERTQGRLEELVEEVADELAALVEEALDDPSEGAR